MPELAQFDKEKSIMRNLPPKLTAGLAIFEVSAINLLPCPPARSIAMHSLLAINLSLKVRWDV